MYEFLAPIPAAFDSYFIPVNCGLLDIVSNRKKILIFLVSKQKSVTNISISFERGLFKIRHS